MIALIRPVVDGLGYIFWGLEYFVQGRRSLLRIYIDAEEGITVDDCEKVSRQVSGVLDVEDPIKSEYVLEVSSPGWDRPLYEVWQYRQFIGETIELRLSTPFEGRRKFKGVLSSVEDTDEIGLYVDGEEYLFPVEWIEKAKIVPRTDGPATEVTGK
ncbi:MAG: ribosome maturation factor RimP [Gammaproteobacteria bacterium]|nr:MAG: ribosome maturation factor RimP [Gammaproteobacteria bacterium]